MKKANINLKAFSIISLILLLLAGFFIFILYDQVFADYVIEPLDNISNNIATDLNLSNQTVNTLNNINEAYNARNITYDLFFLFLLLILFVGTTFDAVKARKQGILSFFGMLFLGTMFFLISIFFINQFTDYFIINIFEPIFSDTTISTPIFNWFYNNVSVWTSIWFVWLLLVNQMDFLGIVRDKFNSLTEGGFER